MEINKPHKFYFSDYTNIDRNIIVRIGGTIVNGDYEYHTHDFNELFIITGGTGTHIINNVESKLKIGDVYIINDETAHGFKDCNRLQITNIMFQYQTLETFSNVLKTLPGFQALFNLIPYFNEPNKNLGQLSLNQAEINRLNILLIEMKTCFNNKQPGYEIETLSVFLKVVLFLSRIYDYYEKHFDLTITNIAKVFAYIESHYLEEITIDKLSKMACVSNRHFLRLFKENFNITPYKYINSLRMDYARYLLENTTMSITEIASHTRFVDSNYFTRCFKKNANCTPSQYRKKFKNKAL